MTARQIGIGIGLLAAALGVAGCASTTSGGATGPPTTPTRSAAPSTSSVPSTTAAPATPSTSVVPSTSSETTSSPPAVSSTPAIPPHSSRPSTAQPTPAMHKVPPDATAPAAGACSRSAGSQVLVVVNPDVPSPRCVIVAAGQHLAVRNNTGEMGQSARTVTLRWADYPPRTVSPGALTSYPQPFGNYLMPGVHRLQASVYGQDGAEIWLKP